jgi:hypothetical protein
VAITDRRLLDGNRSATVNGKSTPPKSNAEMVALAENTNVTNCNLLETLGLDEEYPDELHYTLTPFSMTI